MGGEEGAEEGAGQSFPGFSWADVGDHFVTAEEHSDGVGAHVGEFGDGDDEDEVEDTGQRAGAVP